MTVHIPFDIFDIGTVEDRRHAFVQIIPDIFSSHIQDQLVTASVRLSSRDLDRPVRMCTVEVAVLGDTFRLKPETELHTHGIDSVCDRFQTAFQLVGIDIPVTQSADISLTFSKPAIVENQHLHAKFGCAFCDVQDLFFIKIKVGCFPVVDQHRTSLMFVFATAQMFPEGMMEVGTHLFKSFAAIGHDSLRCPELCSGFQCPGKSLAVDAGSQSGLSHLVFFCFDREVSTVNQCCSITWSRFFGGIFAAQDGKWIMLVAGCSSDTFHGHLSAHQRYPFHLAFQIVSSVKMHQFPVTAHQIQIHGSSFCQHDRIGSLIYEFYATGNDISFFPHTIV